MTQRTIRIATRKSQLAIWQAEDVKRQLLLAHPTLTVELVPMSTQGDRILDAPLAKVGGKGLFIKELEIAMQDGRADIAVHSMKDVPVEIPANFNIHAICKRADPRDAFVSNQFGSLQDLPVGAVVGTSSLRRQCQIKALRPDLRIKDLRGNINTRLSKLDQGQYQAIVLASAGLLRLNMTARIQSYLEPVVCLPAVGQGAVGVECRDDDEELIALLQALHHPDTATCVTAERAMNARLQGGCQVPIGSYGTLVGERVHLRGLVGDVDGQKILKAEQIDAKQNPVAIGQKVAESLLQQGAATLLAAVTEH